MYNHWRHVVQEKLIDTDMTQMYAIAMQQHVRNKTNYMKEQQKENMDLLNYEQCYTLSHLLMLLLERT